jgi:hypothetical protein
LGIPPKKGFALVGLFFAVHFIFMLAYVGDRKWAARRSRDRGRPAA